ESLCCPRALCNRSRRRSTAARRPRWALRRSRPDRTARARRPRVSRPQTSATKASRAEPQAAARTAYLVLGMHRSGTSAVTQVLALAGASLPQNVMAGDEHNARGYFEPWKIALLNDERLRAAGAAWDDVFAFPFRPLAPRVERGWLNRAQALFGEE